ncbi:MAG: hypothetical protein WD266_06965, partial [Balneolales bacterium]
MILSQTKVNEPGGYCEKFFQGLNYAALFSSFLMALTHPNQKQALVSKKQNSRKTVSAVILRFPLMISLSRV